ncbi:type II secretion system minor pseudopilin GspK [Vibrio methylphosphonaticus]|uniref:type II secretion system minor pseudopilin GspK n=1 Tax=Vibrio methylphosphonaticus TaxID=2946866 RepID=UPI00387324C3
MMKKSYGHSSSQKGVALIVILLLLAIMVSIAATMSERLFSQFTRANSQINYQQAYWYSIGVEALATVAIKESFKDNKDSINLNQPWAIEERTYPLDYGEATGRIVDMQSCFNINALSSIAPTANSTEKPFLVRFFQRLLEQYDVENYQAEQIADSTWEFVNKETTVRSISGVGDSYYESLSPAYVTANGLLADSSELRAINQVMGDITLRLGSSVCALPMSTWQLNVNTLAPENADVLVALFAPNLSRENALQLLENRPFDGWSGVDKFLAESQMSSVDENARKQASQYLSVDSVYFELDAQVVVDESRLRLRTLFYSQDRENLTVVRRRFGGLSERVLNRSTE